MTVFTDSLRGSPVLITGGTGFVGAHLARRLLALGAGLHVTGRDPWRVASLALQVHAAPLEAPEGLGELVRRLRPAVVFHLAASTSRTRELSHLGEMLRQNVLPLAALLAAAGEVGARVVTLGSAEEYGQSPAPWTEESPTAPVSPYGVSKLAATEIARAASRAGVFVSVARPSVIYGPGQAPAQFIPALLATLETGRDFAMSPGEQTRDFVFVEDIVSGLLALLRDEARGEVFHLCAGESHSLRTIAEAARSLVGRGTVRLGALPYREKEVMEQAMSGEKARRVLGWVPRVSLAAGLARTREAS
jgi:UDP-glucose 4-epimerase